MNSNMNNKFRTTTWNKYSARKELEEAKEELQEYLRETAFMYAYHRRHMKEYKRYFNEYKSLLKDANKLLKKSDKKSK